MYVLPEEIVCSLVNIYEQGNDENDFMKQNTDSDSFLNFFHIMCFRTCKHKRQRLVLKKNWKNVLNRISNLKKKYSNHFCTNKNHQSSNETSSKMQVSALTQITSKLFQYLVFSLSVISLPGLIIMYLLIPKVNFFLNFCTTFQMIG